MIGTHEATEAALAATVAALEASDVVVEVSSVLGSKACSRGEGRNGQMAQQWRGVLREYADRLDISEATPIITLGEGGTPLIAADAVSARIGAKVWVKFEGMNPTGSFKDRGMTMAISKAVEHGAKAVICASTGNTSASAAAYAVAAGITAVVLVPEGKIAMGKLSQAVAHNGAPAAGAGQLRRLPRDRARTRRQLPGAPGQLGQQRPHRGPEDGGVRGRRGARRRARLPLHPGRQRRQLHGLHPRLRRRARRAAPRTVGPACSASRPRAVRRS